MIVLLLGSYLLAKNKANEWLLFMIMSGSMGTLMIIQKKSILDFQQAVSLCFVVYGFMTAVKVSKGKMLTNKLIKNFGNTEGRKR